jgi:hypothetical protein
MSLSLRVGISGMIPKFVGLALVALVSRVMGCGISWTVPTTYFDGVDEKGHVCYSRQIGEVDFGEQLKLPLIINFRSDRESSSPYLGKGWILALLDSSFVQTGENAFLMTQPDGWVRPFFRAKASETVLNGGSWKAEIKGDTISAYASCGWKLVYTKGRLTSIGTSKNRNLELVYSGNKVMELREAGAAKLVVEFDEAAGRARTLAFNGKQIWIAQAERPRVQVINGQNVIGGMDQSLHQLSGAVAKTGQHFTFAVDDKLRPTLNISGIDVPDRLFVWDGGTKLILKDGELKYDITPGAVAWQNAGIARTNAAGQRESWRIDGAKGEETFELHNGVIQQRKWFTSGVLKGLLRSSIETQGGREISNRKYSYDQQGRPLRLIDRVDGVVNYYYNSAGETEFSGSAEAYEQLLMRELQLLAAYDAAEASQQEASAYKLAIFYLEQRKNSSAARKWTKRLGDSDNAVTVMLRLLETQDAESRQSGFKALLDLYPDQRERLDALAQNYR